MIMNTLQWPKDNQDFGDALSHEDRSQMEDTESNKHQRIQGALHMAVNVNILIHFNRILAAIQSGDIDRAELCLQEAYGLANTIEDTFMIARCEFWTGTVSAAKGQVHAACCSFLAALDIMDDASFESDKILVYLHEEWHTTCKVIYEQLLDSSLASQTVQTLKELINRRKQTMNWKQRWPPIRRTTSAVSIIRRERSQSQSSVVWKATQSLESVQYEQSSKPLIIDHETKCLDSPTENMEAEGHGQSETEGITLDMLYDENLTVTSAQLLEILQKDILEEAASIQQPEDLSQEAIADDDDISYSVNQQQDPGTDQIDALMSMLQNRK